MHAQHVRYIAETATADSTPARNAEGLAWPAGGYADPESCEQGAYLFQPFGDESAYYVDPGELEQVEP